MGADPVSCSLSYTSYLRDEPIEAMVIRKEPKDHGRGLQIEGMFEKGDDVVILDDVLTTVAEGTIAFHLHNHEITNFTSI